MEIRHLTASYIYKRDIYIHRYTKTKTNAFFMQMHYVFMRNALQNSNTFLYKNVLGKNMVSGI